MMMIFRIITFSFVLLIASCSDGTTTKHVTPDSTPVNDDTSGSITPQNNTGVRPITTNRIVEYSNGDSLTYTSTTDYFSNSHQPDKVGVLTVNFSGRYTGGTQEIQRVIEHHDFGEDKSTTELSHIIYSAEGDLLAYIVGQDNRYSNQNEGEYENGSLLIPSALHVGSSWATTNEVFMSDDYYVYGDKTYVVVKKENVTVPSGEFEAFKIDVDIDGSINSLCHVDPASTSFCWRYHAEVSLWVNPSFGVVKKLISTRKKVDGTVGSIDGFFKEELESYDIKALNQ